MYTTRQVADLLHLPARQVREYARAGFLSPSRTPRGWYQFDFQDLVVLRTAVRLAQSDTMSHRRVRRTFGHLKAQLSPERSLTEIGVAPTSDGVLVQDGPTVWDPETGQMHLNFASHLEQDAAAAATTVAVPPPATIPLGRAEVVAQGWFELGCEQESEGDDAAVESYRRAIAINPRHADARVNLGRMLQRLGDTEDAITQYEAALDVAPYHATAAFNLGVALERARRAGDAVAAYQRAVELDPDLADAHYNLARLHERAGDARDALRHFQIYKKLTGRFRPTRRR